MFEVDDNEIRCRWGEVKSMTGSLEQRSVRLSYTQFKFARQNGEAFWLYIVEYANNPTNARIVKIHNPFGHARTFTFNKGWLEIVELTTCNN